MRRVWMYLRDLVWTAVASVAFAVVSLIALASGNPESAGVFAWLAIGSAILSTRS